MSQPPKAKGFKLAGVQVRVGEVKPPPEAVATDITASVPQMFGRKAAVIPKVPAAAAPAPAPAAPKVRGITWRNDIGLPIASEEPPPLAEKAEAILGEAETVAVPTPSDPAAAAAPTTDKKLSLKERLAAVSAKRKLALEASQAAAAPAVAAPTPTTVAPEIPTVVDPAGYQGVPPELMA